ncbi:AAA family ATPase [Alcaligenaceae bacterium]|nr:AAA family ATPase [Alcaligenaceae bacterium]
MNIFVAGIHGVGKTHVASRLSPSYGLLHTSASKLIREERTLPNWNTDKRVTDVDANQVALAAAVARYNGQGTRLLLDGHFVLLDPNAQFIALEAQVFQSLSLSAVILIQADAKVIAERLKARDAKDWNLQWLNDFMTTERNIAQTVSQELRIPLHIVVSANNQEFERAVATCISNE